MSGRGRRTPEGDRIGVLLLNLGGPWGPDDVGPFLRSLFNDRGIIPFPGGPALQGIWAAWISALRAPKVRRRYAAIGGGSPLLFWTRLQARGLERLLNGRSLNAPDGPEIERLRTLDVRDPVLPGSGTAGRFTVAVGMRYSAPESARAVARLAGAGCRRIVVLPLYPQECAATTGSGIAQLNGIAEREAGDSEFLVVRSFYDHPGYVRAVAETLREQLVSLPEEIRAKTVVVFSAHGIPMRIARSGDPYVDQIRETVDRLVGEMGDEIGDYRLAYQSRTGPVRWTGPGTIEVLADLGRRKTLAVVVVPLSFVSDHIETLHEIDIEFAEIARRAGIPHFRRAACLNDRRPFIETLCDLVHRALDRPREAEAPPATAGQR